MIQTKKIANLRIIIHINFIIKNYLIFALFNNYIQS